MAGQGVGGWQLGKPVNARGEGVMAGIHGGLVVLGIVHAELGVGCKICFLFFLCIKK